MPAMAGLVLGPLLRYVGSTEATIWVETDGPCEVEVLGRNTRTFGVEGQHYALVLIEDLEPGSSEEYEVKLDGERAWPPPDSSFPPSVLRTFREREQLELVFGSCRVALPHEPPYTLPKETDEENGRVFDALHALARSLLEADAPSYPDLLFLCGDQVYADQVSPQTLEFIHERDDRPPGAPPDEVADFEEYTRLYRQAWSERVIGGMMAYWLYQFIGNLAPRELADRPLWNRVKDAEDAGRELRAFMAKDDRDREGRRWSYYRDLGTTRLIVLDDRTGRLLEEGERRIVDDEEWEWIVERSTERDEIDHLLFGSSDPWLLVPSLQNLEAWNEQVCGGRWGRLAARRAERMRQALDFDHWGAFQASFRQLVRLIREVGSGEHGEPPATIGVLSGDVHHAYLAEVAFPRGSGVRSSVYQGVCSPYRNALDSRERRTIKLAHTQPVAAL